MLQLVLVLWYSEHRILAPKIHFPVITGRGHPSDPVIIEMKTTAWTRCGYKNNEKERRKNGICDEQEFRRVVCTEVCT